MEEVATGREQRPRNLCQVGGRTGGAPHIRGGQVEQGGGGVGDKEEGAPADCTHRLLQQVRRQGRAGGGEVDC